MTDELIETLKGLNRNPSLAVELYRQLYEESFFALVKAGSEKSLESLLFLTYETADGVHELPVFTLEQFVLTNLARESVLIHINGPVLWSRMLDIVETARCEVAVDPSQAHGIRLNREMILGMVSKYGPKPA